MGIWEEGSGRPLANQVHLRIIETTLGQTFPTDVLAIFQTHNAAVFELQMFPVVTPDGPEDKSVAVLLDAGGDETHAESLPSQWRMLQTEHGIASHIVPFGMDGGGNLVCLDFSAAPEPAVVYWQHDEVWAPLRVAERFADFLQHLHEGM